MSEAPRYDDIRGKVRGLLITLADQLPAVTVGLVDELLDANELGVAVETMSEILVDSGARISPQTMDVFENVIEEMKLDQAHLERLRVLVIDAEDPM